MNALHGTRGGRVLVPATLLILAVGTGAMARGGAAQGPGDGRAGVSTRQGKDGGWGEADGGVRIRVRPGKREWRADEAPELRLDVSNGKGGLTVRNFPHCEVEVDGRWYVSPLDELVAGACVLPQGSLREGFAAVRLRAGEWGVKPEGNGGKKAVRVPAPEERLKLAPGKHTIRVACDVDAYHPVSPPVEIRILEAK